MSDIQVTPINQEVTAEHPGVLKRLLWVFTSPGKLMASLAEKPKVLFTLILCAIPLDLLYFLQMPLYKDLLRNAAIAQSQSSYMQSLGVEMTPEMIEATLPTSVMTGLIGGPIGTIIMMLLTTLICFAIFRIMGGEGKFKAYLSVVSHASVISALYTLLLIPISYATGSLNMTSSLTSLATLVSMDAVGPVIYGILSSLDIFKIWYYVVAAIGMAAVSKLKKKNVYIVVAVLFVISMIITITGMQAAGQFLGV
ncbi:MAG TPA: YIP1 family protein [Clostridia bacterium]|nr:YIP1 family protein [Clostridia bacterium]